MTSKGTRILVGVAMGAGAIGVILALAGVHSAVRTALVLLFLAVAPTAAIAGLLRGFDPFARIILAVVTTVAVLSIVAMILLSTGLWSPIGELIGVALITVLCLVAQVPSVQARVAAWARTSWQALRRRIPGLRTVAPEPEVTEPIPARAPTGNGQYVADEPPTQDLPAVLDEPVTLDEPATVHEPAPVVEPATVVEPAPVVEPAKAAVPATAYATEIEGHGNGRANGDRAETDRTGADENEPAELADDAGNGDAPETAGPHEVTSPLPAIRD